MSERSEHDARMDALATRVGEALDGAPLADVISACAAIIGYTLAEVGRDDAEREKVFQTTIAFIRQVCADEIANDRLRSN
jgi:hypothetical protein